MATDAPGLIRERALGLGFDCLGFARSEAIGGAATHLREFLEKGHHGDMGWLADRAALRADPNRLWPEAKTAIMVGANYGPEDDPMASLKRSAAGTVSVYARHRDYHDVMKGRLKQLAGWLHSRFGAAVKVFVDTAPLMEKPLAQAAGLGWQGKHTNLVSREFGSWLFLGAVLTDMVLPESPGETDHCGRCRACLDICPTKAFPAPYQLDARRCISYLTIEHKGHIDRALRPLMGNRIYGCDDCLAVCPWNKFARPTAEARFRAREDLKAPALAELASLTDAGFRKRFAGSPIKRTGRDRFVRNVLIAIGNSGEASLAGAAGKRLRDPSPLVRAMAVWALSRLLPDAAWRKLKHACHPQEQDPSVAAEWRNRT